MTWKLIFKLLEPMSSSFDSLLPCSIFLKPEFGSKSWKMMQWFRAGCWLEDIFFTLRTVCQTNIPAGTHPLILPVKASPAEVLLNTAVWTTVNPFFVSRKSLALVGCSESVQMKLTWDAAVGVLRKFAPQNLLCWKLLLSLQTLSVTIMTFSSTVLFTFSSHACMWEFYWWL